MRARSGSRKPVVYSQPPDRTGQGKSREGRGATDLDDLAARPEGAANRHKTQSLSSELYKRNPGFD